MSKRIETEHPEVRALEDLAWNLKDLAADFYPRSLSAPDRAAVLSATRDTQRIYDRLIAVRDKRKRANGEVVDGVVVTPAPSQTELTPSAGED